MAPILLLGCSIIFVGLAFVLKKRFTKGFNETSKTCGFRDGENFKLCENHILDFSNNGLSIVENVITEDELKEIEIIYDKFMLEGNPAIHGKDFCDMSKSFDTPRSNYSVINAMLPRRYYPELQNNIYERVAANIASQLFPNIEMVLDYDQLLDKTPGAEDAVFSWHQDMAYWPSIKMTPDTRTVTFSLALDSTNIDNGCIRYIPGSGKDKQLRPHNPIGTSRQDAHAIAATVEEYEVIKYAPVERGSITMHDEYVVHGSGGNRSQGRRRTYVVAFRVRDTVERERAAGFTHSHNDKVNWDEFNNWDGTKSSA